MSESSFDVIEWIGWLLWGTTVVVFLVIVVEINEIGVIVIASLPLRAVAGEVSLLATLETCIMLRSKDLKVRLARNIEWWRLNY